MPSTYANGVRVRVLANFPSSVSIMEVSAEHILESFVDLICRMSDLRMCMVSSDRTVVSQVARGCIEMEGLWMDG